MAKRKPSRKPAAFKSKAKARQKPKHSAAAPRDAAARPSKPAAAQTAEPVLEQPHFQPALDADSVVALPEEIAFPVVGIGASAGGLQACHALLSSLPEKLGMAIVLVQHLDPKHESSLPELLASASKIPVVQVADGMEIERDQVYVIPPNAQMALLNGKLHLIPRPRDQSQYMPIDFFMRSLAHVAQQRAIGVVLSGTGSDGAVGLREIKGGGGITFAQDPSSAKYDGMPRAAIAMDVVDMVKSPQEIGEELVRISKHPYVRPLEQPRGEADGFEESLGRIFVLLRNATGVDFTHYKQPTIRRRLRRRMVLHKMNNLRNYAEFLKENPVEVQSLYQDILIHVTRFFREPDSFITLAKRVYPRIMDSRRGGDVPVRVWIPGCSTGEEAYSVAISLLEFFGDRANSVPAQIFATDVSESAVHYARTGMYPESIAADVSVDRLRRFFNKVDGSYRISKQVRDICVFARQDLTRDPPFSKLDLIVCRNVLIYLGTVLQKRLMSVFHYALKPSGFLMLGGAETIGTSRDLFSVEDKRHRLYIKKLVDVPREMEFHTHEHLSDYGDRARAIQPLERNAQGSVQSEANRIVLSRYSPPGVLVDNELQIVQFRGHTGPYLEPAPGEASFDLLKMAREGLLYGLRSAIYESRKNDTSVRKSGLRVLHEGAIREVEVEVIPLTGDGQAQHFLILFHDARKAAVAVENPKTRGKKAKKGERTKTSRRDQERLRRLQEELAASREYLQSIIQDLEAANEELQSANEEILSSNEELQSTNEELDTAKEELQSTNEELNTVNEELQGRNEELSRVNSDLLNLLGSVEIAIVMVTSDLRIRRFTPMAERVLNLLPHDVGRRISDIKPNIEVPDLEKLIIESIDRVIIKEMDVSDRGGKTYSLRIRPYKNADNRIDGAVLALFEQRATHVAPGDGALALAKATPGNAIGRALIDANPDPVILLNSNARVLTVNEAFSRYFKVLRADVEGRDLFHIFDGQFDVPELRDVVQQRLVKQERIEGVVLDREFPGVGRRQMTVNAQVVASEDGGSQTLLVFSTASPSPSRST
jgi:two-component system CheB/CheR fusion protein